MKSYDQTPENEKKSKWTLRNCMAYTSDEVKCNAKFKSQGSHHRMCNDCRKRTNEGLNGNGSTGRMTEAKRY